MDKRLQQIIINYVTIGFFMSLIANSFSFQIHALVKFILLAKSFSVESTFWITQLTALLLFVSIFTLFTIIIRKYDLRQKTIFRRTLLFVILAYVFIVCLDFIIPLVTSSEEITYLDNLSAYIRETNGSIYIYTSLFLHTFRYVIVGLLVIRSVREEI